ALPTSSRQTGHPRASLGLDRGRKAALASIRGSDHQTACSRRRQRYTRRGGAVRYGSQRLFVRRDFVESVATVLRLPAAEVYTLGTGWGGCAPPRPPCCTSASEAFGCRTTSWWSDGWPIR